MNYQATLNFVYNWKAENWIGKAGFEKPKLNIGILKQKRES